MNYLDIEKAADQYINSDDFPVIGYPHLAKQDFIKGMLVMYKMMLEEDCKWFDEHWRDYIVGPDKDGCIGLRGWKDDFMKREIVK